MNVYGAHATSTVPVSDEAAEFGRAVDRYKRESHRPHPAFTEILAIFVSLGYRRVCPREELPHFCKGLPPVHPVHLEPLP